MTLGSIPKNRPIRTMAMVPIPPPTTPRDIPKPRRSSMFWLSCSWSSRIELSLISRHGHPGNLQSRRGDSAPELEIAADHFDILKDLFEIACDRHFLNRIRQLALVDPDPGGAPGVITGYHVNAKADQLGDIKPVGHGADNFLRRLRSCLEEEIRRRDTRRISDRPRSIARGSHSELLPTVSVEQIRSETSVLDDDFSLDRQAFTIEWFRSEEH